jgi:uncharacterized protein involved in exopolysaccharide biosynthesis
VEPKSQVSTVLDSRSDADLDLGRRLDLLAENQRQSTLARLQLLWSQRGLLQRFTAWGVVVFTLIAILLPPRYESTTKLMPPDQKSEGMAMIAALTGGKIGGDSIMGGLPQDLLGFKTTGALFVGVLHSRTVQDALVRRFDLRKVYWDRRWEDARKDLENMTFISEDRKTGIIEIRVRDKNPQRAQAMAQAFVEELDRAVNKLSTSAARREREFLETRLAEVKKSLDQSSRDFSRFASQNTAIDIPAQGRAMVEAAAVLQGQLMAAQAEEEGLRQIYTSNNVRVRALESRISELRRQLDKFGSAGTNVASGSDADLNSEDTASGESLFPSIRKLPLLGVPYWDYYRQMKIQEAVFETLTKQYEMAKVQEAKEIPQVRVLDPANAPERRSGPPRFWIVVFGALLSLMVGSAWTIIRVRWEEDPDDPRKVFAVEVLTSLTAATKKSWTKLMSLRKRNAAQSANSRGPFEGC